MLFALHLECQKPEQRIFCCFYDYDPKTQMLNPEDVPYKKLKRKWAQSSVSYFLGHEFDQTVIVQETNSDSDLWSHHYAWNGMKHEFHHDGPESYSSDDDGE